jgi:voltage-gated sodium channel
MVSLFQSIARSTRFQGFITFVILAAGVLVGLETYGGFASRHAQLLDFGQGLVLAIFIAEIVVKMGAEGSRPWLYFRDGWNVFDFMIVAACFLPVGSEYAMVLRLARLLRVLKLVRALPKLQLLVSALLKSIPSMAYVTLLLFLLFYVYGCAGVFLFGKNDPVHFENLQIAMLSLFRVVTLEDWTDIMYTQIFGCDVYGFNQRQTLCVSPESSPMLAPMFFVSFILLGTMIVLNLFVGVIMNAMQEAHTDALREEQLRKLAQKGVTMTGELRGVEEQLLALQKALSDVVRRSERWDSVRPPAPAAPGSNPGVARKGRPVA